MSKEVEKDMSIDRVIDVIKKAKVIMAQVKDEKAKAKMGRYIDMAEVVCLEIKKNNWPCPEDMKNEMEEALSCIEKLYGEKGTN